MQILDLKQGSPEWWQARAGIPTASEFGSLITPLGKARTGQGVETYLHRKLAERWLQGPLPGAYYGGATEQGTLREPEALRWYALTRKRPIKPAGFVLSDDGRIGCSPDGLFADGTGIESKCPDIHTHIGYLLAGGLPAEYVAQVQGAMLVTGAPRWTFLSYSRGLPPLDLVVERDEEFLAALAGALAEFGRRLDEGHARLVALAGRRPGPDEEPDDDDVIAW
jgi:hypothetical protein